jgi:hypothetical protein
VALGEIRKGVEKLTGPEDAGRRESYDDSGTPSGSLIWCANLLPFDPDVADHLGLELKSLRM